MANALNTDLLGLMIRVDGYPIPVRCTGGNGAHSFTNGTMVVCKDETTGQTFSVRGNQVKSIVPDPDTDE